MRGVPRLTSLELVNWSCSNHGSASTLQGNMSGSRLFSNCKCADVQFPDLRSCQAVTAAVVICPICNYATGLCEHMSRRPYQSGGPIAHSVVWSDQATSRRYCRWDRVAVYLSLITPESGNFLLYIFHISKSAMVKQVLEVLCNALKTGTHICTSVNTVRPMVEY